MERQLPAVKVWLTSDAARRAGHVSDDQLSHISVDLDGAEPWGTAAASDNGVARRQPDVVPPANYRKKSLVLLARPTSNRLEPLVHPAHRRRSSAGSTASIETTSESRRGSAFSQRSSSLTASECSYGSRGRTPAVAVLPTPLPPSAASVENRLSLPSTVGESRRLSRASMGSRGSRLSHSYELAALRRPSTLSRLSQTLSLSSHRGSVFFVKGCGGDDAPWSLQHAGPQRLTFTQRLAFPTLAGGEMRHKRRDPFNETEAHMNLFAKLITVVILCLVFVLLVGVMYRFLR